MTSIIFDLDGTLSDSSRGVLQSFNYALDKMGHSTVLEHGQIGRYIGPSLNDSFSWLLETEEPETLTRAVAFFREDYIASGYKINQLYEGIEDALTQLKSSGHQLFIATSKKQSVACDVLDHLRLTDQFCAIYGGGSVIPKPKLLEQLLQQQNCHKERAIMIGDTHYDIEAAQENGILSLGVSWGFGGQDELATAAAVIDRPQQLVTIIEQLLGNGQNKRVSA